jgi:tight adherence protein B
MIAMSSGSLFAAIFVGGGLSLVVAGVLMRVRDRERALADILDLPFGERDVPVESVTESYSQLTEGAIGLAGRMVEQFDTKGSLTASLERARLPVRPGEFVLLTLSGGLVFGAILAGITTQWFFGIVGVVASPFLANVVVRRRISRRRKKFEQRLPDALTLVASSLSAGHTFLRAIQMMCAESEPPLSEEFSRVVSETRLGGSLVDALDRMAKRLQLRDLDWVVQAIRIQQTVGGKLADVLHTLADFIRAREEVRREVDVLTAEGRISAYVLGALPLFLLLAVQVISPGYMDPMYHGVGPFVLAGTGLSVVFGTWLIFRMVKSIEV